MASKTLTSKLLAEDFARKLPGLPGLSPIDAAQFEYATECLADAVRKAADQSTPAWKVDIDKVAYHARRLAHTAIRLGLIKGAR